MGAIEQKYCRAPLARSFNQSPGVRWIPNTNYSFSPKFGREGAFKGDYESGRPDAFAWCNGQVICVECKAAFEKFYLKEWSDEQRKWWMNVAMPTHVPYYVAIWLCEERTERIDYGGSGLYLVPATAVTTCKAKSIGFRDAEDMWKSFKLLWNASRRVYLIDRSLWRSYG